MYSILALFSFQSQFEIESLVRIQEFDLRRQSDAHLAIQKILQVEKPKALLLNASQLVLLAEIKQEALPKAVFVLDDGLSVKLPEPNCGAEISIISGSSRAEIEQRALTELERYLRPRPAFCQRQKATRGTVWLIGAGIVNLITALEVVQAGFEVTIIDRMPDPLQTDIFDVLDTGATFGGMDARVFSLNESRHHLFRGIKRAGSEIGPFRKRVSDIGWLSRDHDTFDDSEKSWISHLERVPSWLAAIYNDDTIAYNRISADGWAELFSLHPKLLRGVNHNSTLLRVYQTPESFETAQRQERNLGSCLEVIPNDTLVRRQPSFAQAISSGAIAGAMHVEGFSLNVKSFSRNLIRLLETMGVCFRWNTRLNALSSDDAGRITALRVGDETLPADNVVLCPGAFAALSCNTLPALDDIASMVGMWITLPNEQDSLTAPLKVRRRGFAASEAAEGANIIPGRDAQSRPVIYCSSGHGFVGTSPAGIEQSDLSELLRCIKETSAELFPDKFAEAKRRGMLDVDPKYCIRPWTWSGLGVFDTRETASGGQLVLTGGHNTGGFAQAPAVARAVRATLSGETPNMAEIYHPHRAHALLL